MLLFQCFNKALLARFAMEYWLFFRGRQDLWKLFLMLSFFFIDCIELSNHCLIFSLVGRLVLIALCKRRPAIIFNFLFSWCNEFFFFASLRSCLYFSLHMYFKASGFIASILWCKAVYFFDCGIVKGRCLLMLMVDATKRVYVLFAGLDDIGFVFPFHYLFGLILK